MEEQTNHLPQVEEAPPAAQEPEQPPEAKAEQPLSKAGERLPEGVVDEPPDPTAMQAEIERLRQVQKKAEEDAKYWRQQKAEARAEYFRDRERGGQQAPVPPPADVPSIAPEPKPADFTDYDQFVVALTDWRVKQARTQWEMESQRKAQQEALQHRQENLKTKLQEGYQLYPDFEEVAFDRTASHITPMVVDILAECDHPADVAYYLAKNRVEGMAISRMTPLAAARAIAKLEDKLVAFRASNPAPTTKPITKAPPPIKPVTGNAPVAKDPEKMTQKEYEAWRKSQGARPF